MKPEWLTLVWENYNWLGALLSLASVVLLSKLGKWLVFRVPDLERMRQYNKQEDQIKWKQEKFPPIVRATQKTGMYCNAIFFVVLLPFCVTFQAQPAWKVLLDVFVILMFYDFFYYMSHRFWFHGNGPMRKIHAVHHQARNPTYLDAHYVHPTETFIGLALYMGSVVLLAAVMGKFHWLTMVTTYLIFVQINQINHTYVNLPRFPFKTLSWITAKHHVHHENMHKGNYATITLFYDKLFGTLD